MEKKKTKFSVVEIIICVVTLLLFFKFIRGKK